MRRNTVWDWEKKKQPQQQMHMLHRHTNTGVSVHKVPQSECGFALVVQIHFVLVSTGRTSDSTLLCSACRNRLFALCRHTTSTAPPARLTAGSPAWSGIPLTPPPWPWAPRGETCTSGTLRFPPRKPSSEGCVPACRFTLLSRPVKPQEKTE